MEVAVALAHTAEGRWIKQLMSGLVVDLDIVRGVRGIRQRRDVAADTTGVLKDLLPMGDQRSIGWIIGLGFSGGAGGSECRYDTMSVTCVKGRGLPCIVFLTDLMT